MVHNLHSLLKEQTKAEHIALEKQVMTHLRQIRTTNHYGQLLAKFHRYINRLEGEINLHPIRDALKDYEHRRKSVALESDMQLIDFSLPPSFTSLNLPSLNSLDKVYGALYVLEGSTMGGPFIKAIVLKKLPDLPEAAFSYYSGYGAKNTEMWTTFVDNLNTSSLNEVAVLEGARETFVTFHEALR